MSNISFIIISLSLISFFHLSSPFLVLTQRYFLFLFSCQDS